LLSETGKIVVENFVMIVKLRELILRSTVKMIAGKSLDVIIKRLTIKEQTI